jgi:hypothetical protein
MGTTASAANSRARASGHVVSQPQWLAKCRLGSLHLFTPKAVILSRIVLSTDDTVADAGAKVPPAYWDTPLDARCIILSLTKPEFY